MTIRKHRSHPTVLTFVSGLVKCGACGATKGSYAWGQKCSYTEDQ